ncbi:MAG: protein MobC [Bilophila wadsworthia]
MTAKGKSQILGYSPSIIGENTMTITASQLKEIRQEFAKLKPAAVTLDGNRAMTVKQAIFTLAPTLERMKKRGFDTQEIVERLHEKGIEVKPQTLTKYLTEARRQRDGQKNQKKDTPPPHSLR